MKKKENYSLTYTLEITFLELVMVFLNMLSVGNPLEFHSFLVIVVTNYVKQCIITHFVPFSTQINIEENENISCQGRIGIFN